MFVYTCAHTVNNKNLQVVCGCGWSVVACTCRPQATDARASHASEGAAFGEAAHDTRDIWQSWQPAFLQKLVHAEPTWLRAVNISICIWAGLAWICAPRVARSRIYSELWAADDGYGRRTASLDGRTLPAHIQLQDTLRHNLWWSRAQDGQPVTTGSCQVSRVP